MAGDADDERDHVASDWRWLGDRPVIVSDPDPVVDPAEELAPLVAVFN